MKKQNKLLFSVLSVAMLFLSLIAIPQSVQAAPKDGCYVFTMNGSSVDCFYNTKGQFVVKKESVPYLGYAKKKFNTDLTETITKNYCFKIADEVYTWQTEDPVHTVKKFGVELSVTRDETISKDEFVEQFSGGHICLYLIIKNGKIVAAGGSA